MVKIWRFRVVCGILSRAKWACNWPKKFSGLGLNYLLMSLPVWVSPWTSCPQTLVSEETFVPFFSINQIKCVSAEPLMAAHRWGKSSGRECFYTAARDRIQLFMDDGTGQISSCLASVEKKSFISRSEALSWSQLTSATSEWAYYHLYIDH